MKQIKLIFLALFFSSFAGLNAVAAETAITAENSATSTSVSSEQSINLNTASVEELMTLPGIGKSKANAIIAYRDEVGEFLEVEQLTQVKGIGEKMLAKVRDKIAVK
ncbi:ComEA family DNA-binding protein [Alteromonas pelagimontana]|uniref:ComEA family DNA-binding protein n=1 Tax=Alteromonas pelagimontana TaxID=1858656 RepID=A0A6M4MGM8_9ALTE|nr:ComEA family DNA-binding protein [Alteromonas pelagimontana]QJR81755.1 ComEA family DNA-binding protein [Alteromonas pelagimontana]